MIPESKLTALQADFPHHGLIQSLIGEVRERRATEQELRDLIELKGGVIRSLSARVAAQSDLLSRRSEKANV